MRMLEDSYVDPEVAFFGSRHGEDRIGTDGTHAHTHPFTVVNLRQRSHKQHSSFRAIHHEDLPTYHPFRPFRRLHGLRP
jgi:hypothetical protein